MIHSDKFRINTIWYDNNEFFVQGLWCDECRFQILLELDDESLSALISRAEAHWNQLHLGDAEASRDDPQ